MWHAVLLDCVLLLRAIFIIVSTFLISLSNYLFPAFFSFLFLVALSSFGHASVLSNAFFNSYADCCILTSSFKRSLTQAFSIVTRIPSVAAKVTRSACFLVFLCISIQLACCCLQHPLFFILCPCSLNLLFSFPLLFAF